MTNKEPQIKFKLQAFRISQSQKQLTTTDLQIRGGETFNPKKTQTVVGVIVLAKGVTLLPKTSILKEMAAVTEAVDQLQQRIKHNTQTKCFLLLTWRLAQMVKFQGKNRSKLIKVRLKISKNSFLDNKQQEELYKRQIIRLS